MTTGCSSVPFKTKPVSSYGAAHQNMSRAKLLGLFAACLLLLIMRESSSSITDSEPATDKIVRTKVLILGAGLSGITAATTLLENNITDFYVLEGQDYIGGRIHAVSFDELTIETGANWLHSLDDEESAALAKRMVDTKMSGVWCNYSDFVIRLVVNNLFLG